MKTTILSKSISNGTQDVNLLYVLKVGTHKIRIRIRSDSHAFQSHAKAERWNGEQWHEVAHIPFGLMKTSPGLYYQHNVHEGHFSADLEHLRKEVLLVLA